MLFLSVILFSGCNLTKVTRERLNDSPSEFGYVSADLEKFPSNEYSTQAQWKAAHNASAEAPATLLAGTSRNAFDMVSTGSLVRNRGLIAKLEIDKNPVEVHPIFERFHPVENTCIGSKCASPAATEGWAMGGLVNSLLVAEPGTVIKSFIKVLHLVGIVLGLGAATVLDIVIVRFLVLREIRVEHAALVDFVSKIVTFGLIILWISGVCYLAHYAVFDPEKLGNQKVWAKILIVAVLTINGYFIHHTVLPLVRNQVGKELFRGLSRQQCGQLLVFGTISATSWYVPLFLGAMPHFNFVVPATEILAAYAAILSIAIFSTQGIIHALWKEEPSEHDLANYETLMRRATEVVGSDRTASSPINTAMPTAQAA